MPSQRPRLHRTHPPAHLPFLRDHAGLRHAPGGGHPQKIGDGIICAIDFTLDLEREADTKGDRVNIPMSGKVLPYKKW